MKFPECQLVLLVLSPYFCYLKAFFHSQIFPLLIRRAKVCSSDSNGDCDHFSFI